MGQNGYSNRGSARSGAKVEVHSLVLDQLLFPEIRPIATIIYQTKTSYGNAVNARVVSTDEGDDYIDWRSEAVSRASISTSDHNSLSGLAVDSHTQYLLADGSRAMSGDLDMDGNDIIADQIGFCGTTPSTCIDLQNSSFSNFNAFNIELGVDNNTSAAMDFDIEFNSGLSDSSSALRPIQGVVNTQADITSIQQLEGAFFKVGNASVAQTQGTRNIIGNKMEVYSAVPTGGVQDVRGACIYNGGAVAISGSGDITQSGVCIDRSTTIYNGGTGSFKSYGLKISNYTKNFFEDEAYAIQVVDGDVYFPDDVTDGTNSVTVANMKTSYDHVSNNGSDHSYIDQDVTSGANPNFSKISGETKSWDVPILNPNGAYDNDTQIPIAFTTAALTVTKIVVSNNTTSYEVAGDLKWADNLTSFTGATVINDFDTTSGVRTDDTITSGSVAAGKYVYLEFDSQPDSNITFTHVHIEWDYD